MSTQPPPALLPTPRDLITSLLNTLFSYPSSSSSSSSSSTSLTAAHTNLPTSHQNTKNSNPFHALPPAQRALLTTLHVVLPPPVLLHALDLLDRGLVGRVVLGEGEAGRGVQGGGNKGGGGEESEERRRGGEKIGEEARVEREGEDSWRESDEDKEMINRVYLVRSSQTGKGRGRGGDGGGGGWHDVGAGPYVVHLDAWSCSCAAFAFAAFPASYAGFEVADGNGEGDEDGYEEGEKEREEWSYGGMSRPESGAEHTPICKHLLACLLGERWGGVLGGLVKERVVGREEMAGLVV